MTKRKYNFLRLTALLMVILGLLGMLAGIALGVVLLIRPSLVLPFPAGATAFTADQIATYRITGGLVIVGSLLGGLLMAALGQYFQAFLELLEVNRLQFRGIKALVEK